MAVCSANNGHDHLIKLLLIGDSGVGKSSLLSRFTKGKFRLDERPTTANNFVSRHVYIDGKIVKAQIVDIAGNHRFRDFKNDIQTQNAGGALIVYDVTRHDSTIEEVEKWYQELRTANSELEMMLIGNKTDLLEDSSLMTPSIEAGKEFAERSSLGFIDTSAKDDRNVEKAFTELATWIFRKNDRIDTTDARILQAISSEAQMSRSIEENEPAHYMLKIECFSLLSEAEGGTNAFESDIFKAGGYNWLEVYPNGSEEENTRGYISVYVAMCDTESLPKGWEIWIYFKFFVYDHVCQNYIIFQDVDQKRTRFNEKQIKWGFSKLISLDSFTDTGNGFLFHDSCVFGAEVFVAPKYAEKDQCLSMIKSPVMTSTHSWSIDNFSAITDNVLFSDYYKVGKVQWKLVLCPQGFKSRKDTYLPIFLLLHDIGLIPSGWRVYAKYEIRVKNQNAFADRVRKYEEWFDSAARYRVSNFMRLRELHDLDKGFLLNDVLIVGVEFSAVGLLKSFN